MPKATAAELGLHPMAWSLIAVQAVAACLVGCAMWRLHLSLTGWHAEILTAAAFSLCVGLWLQFFLMPCKSGSWETRVAEMMFVLILMIVFTMIGAVAQYPGVALGRPYADSWLANTDALLAINVADLASWTGKHQTILRLLAVSYDSFTPQLVLTVLGLALLKDRQHLWEFAFHYHTCLLMAVIGVALWPALSPSTHYKFTPAIDMTRLIGQVRGFHDGSMSGVPLDQLDGLVSFPSFHVMGALAATWAWRRYSKVQTALVALNVILIASTFMTGVHYFTDVIAGMLLFGCSLTAYNTWPRRQLSSTIRDFPRSTSEPTLTAAPGSTPPISVGGGIAIAK